ncbi:PD40 domain-containing protein [Kitasatospora viridis]|uniref:WD40 repeat protein n=1 Tax=Kitasatospora viridis TaxID=281105 RepID=A0A561UFY5_9ACTN|nr:PD40 domain-containing protein [Kitasatospora viridis]TWF98279.1 WD40 repeat protein [Kitasatospora viridis]
MAVRRRRGTTASLALTAALGVGAALLLSACGPDEVPAAGSTTASPAASAPAAGKPTGTAKPAPAPTGKGSAAPTAAPLPAHGTGVPHLTVSNGTELVALADSTVDFHTAVRDLSWSPDGTRAVFIDGKGDLVTSKPDGTDQQVRATNPGGQTWSHPTWESAKPSQAADVNHEYLTFTVDAGGSTQLYEVPTTGAPAAPTPLPIGDSEPDSPKLPTTGNTWANAAGTQGSMTYANTADGKVYVRDDYLRLNTYSVGAGSEPAVSPQGGEVVFVRSVGGHDHLFLDKFDQQTPQIQDLTPNATTDYTEPAWSPDGKELAVRTPDGVVSLPADGSLQPHPVATHPIGLPAYRA